MQAVRGAGGVPLLLPPGEARLSTAMQGVGAVIVSGGDFDIDPRHYGEAPHPALGRVDALRTDTELALIRLCLERGLPLLGICGGMQALAVAVGGTLIQDLPAQLPHAQEHQQPTDPAEGWHRLTLDPGPLQDLLERDVILGTRPE